MRGWTSWCSPLWIQLCSLKNYHAGSKVNNSYNGKPWACPDSNCHQIQDVAWKMEKVPLGEAASPGCITNANQPQRANSCKTRALITLIIPYSLLSRPSSSKALSDFCRQQKGGGTGEGTREKLGGKSSSAVWQMNASRRGRGCFSQTLNFWENLLKMSRILHQGWVLLDVLQRAGRATF